MQPIKRKRNVYPFDFVAYLKRYGTNNVEIHQDKHELNVLHDSFDNQEHFQAFTNLKTLSLYLLMCVQFAIGNRVAIVNLWFQKIIECTKTLLAMNLPQRAKGVIWSLYSYLRFGIPLGRKSIQIPLFNLLGT